MVSRIRALCKSTHVATRGTRSGDLNNREGEKAMPVRENREAQEPISCPKADREAKGKEMRTHEGTRKTCCKSNAQDHRCT